MNREAVFKGTTKPYITGALVSKDLSILSSKRGFRSAVFMSATKEEAMGSLLRNVQDEDPTLIVELIDAKPMTESMVRQISDTIEPSPDEAAKAYATLRVALRNALLRVHGPQADPSPLFRKIEAGMELGEATGELVGLIQDSWWKDN